MWNKILTKNDIDKLMQTFGDFHDSCIKEIKYMSGAYVNFNLGMHAINDKRILHMIFQRQCKNPTAIEMRFIGLNKLTLIPNNLEYTCEIFEASMMIKNDGIYWFDCADDCEDLSDYNGTYLCAENVEWRIADEYIGESEVYI
jgi:hypothetical protein